jgi:recombination protein RecT
MYKSQIAAALPQHIKADRMARIALTAYRMNPKLAECEPASVFACVIQSAQLGLEIGLNGRAYMIPYYNNSKRKMEAQFIPGWKGLVELANRTGRCAVWTGAVFAGDQFDYELGDNPFVKHKPGSEDDPAKLLFVYAVGRIKGNDFPVIEVWTNEKVKRHFKRYNKVGDKHYAHDNWEMYARKIPLLQVLKYMPSSPELEAAMALEAAAENGEQDLSIKDAIEGTYMPGGPSEPIEGEKPAATASAKTPDSHNGPEKTEKAEPMKTADAPLDAKKLEPGSSPAPTLGEKLAAEQREGTEPKPQRGPGFDEAFDAAKKRAAERAKGSQQPQPPAPTLPELLTMVEQSINDDAVDLALSLGDKLGPPDFAQLRDAARLRKIELQGAK